MATAQVPVTIQSEEKRKTCWLLSGLQVFQQMMNEAVDIVLRKRERIAAKKKTPDAE